MPTVLQINASANWGSTGRIAEGINRAAKSIGWETHIAYSRIADTSESHLIKIGSKFDVLWAVLETRLLDRAGLGMRKATNYLISEIQRINPDIIHLHNIHGYVLNYEILFNYLNCTDIKVVWTFHDFWAITGHCYHFSTMKCDKWISECNHCPQHRNYPASWIDYSFRNYHKKKEVFSNAKNLYIVCVSKWVDSFLPKSFLKDKPHTYISNGVNTAIFKPTAGFSHPKIDNKDFIILGVASQWNQGKGLSDFIALSHIIAPDEKILLIGVNENIIAHLPDNIIGLKRIASTKELAQAYSRANVFVSFSQAETFGLTVLEAMSCGTPVVVYNNSAPPYLIGEGTGYVANDRDYTDAYEYIKKIKEADADKFTKTCFNHVHANYDEKDMYRRYIHLYRQIIQEN